MFVPGGTFFGSFKPFVTMSRNMLPFEFQEAFRFKSWKTRAKFVLLFLTQTLTFKRAKAVIFLTKYARNVVLKSVNLYKSFNTIIPHGIDSSFTNIPKIQKKINTYTDENPYKFLYVSVINPYKHQWNVSEAILKLKDEGFNISLDLIGPSTVEGIKKLNKIIKSNQNNDNKIIKYLGSMKHEELINYYKNADAFVFASSCENMPNILIEAMTSGLPIASSFKGPMPEVLGDAGLYFDPLDIQSIYESLKLLIIDSDQRKIITEKAYQKTKHFTWKECSEKTFKYLLYNINKINYENKK